MGVFYIWNDEPEDVDPILNEYGEEMLLWKGILATSHIGWREESISMYVPIGISAKEYWEDELGYYKYNIESECKRKTAAPDKSDKEK